MNSKERVLAAIAHEEPDKVPVGAFHLLKEEIHRRGDSRWFEITKQFKDYRLFI